MKACYVRKSAPVRKKKYLTPFLCDETIFVTEMHFFVTLHVFMIKVAVK